MICRIKVDWSEGREAQLILGSRRLGDFTSRLHSALPLWGRKVWPWLTFASMFVIIFGFLGPSLGEAFRNLTTPADELGYYQRLAEAFLDGRAYLSERPPKWLLAAANPFDPEVSAPARVHGVHDAILFDEKYWYYWPPGVVAFVVTPLLALSVQVGELQVGFVGLIVLAACGTDAALILQWARGARRSFSILLAFALGLPFSALFLAPRLAIWESNMLAAAALAAVALQCFLRFWLAVPGSSRQTLVIGCIAGALAITVRPEAAIVFVVPLAQFVLGQASSLGLPPIRRWTVALIPIAIIVGVTFVLAYNTWRFGGPLDFKVQYMMTGYEDQSKLVFSSTQYIVPNTYHYIARPIGLSPSFPILDFEKFKWPFTRILSYSELEPTVGAFWVMPWAFLGLGTLIGLRLIGGIRPMMRRVIDERLAILALVLVMGWFILITFLGASIFSATERYHLLPAVLLGIAAMIALAAVPRLFSGSLFARVFRGFICFLLIWTVVAALIGGSHGYYPAGTVVGAPAESASGKVVIGIVEWVVRRI